MELSELDYSNNNPEPSFFKRLVISVIEILAAFSADTTTKHTVSRLND